jgi:hypothetical protein
MKAGKELMILSDMSGGGEVSEYRAGRKVHQAMSIVENPRETTVCEDFPPILGRYDMGRTSLVHCYVYDSCVICLIPMVR